MLPFANNVIRSMLVLGNSPKFVEALKRRLPDATLTILPWRSLSALAGASEVSGCVYDLVFVCGYDYVSYGASYEEYLSGNVYAVIKVLLKCGECRKLVYVDTEDTSKKYTLSRYVYAKKLLGKLLNSTVPAAELHIMRPGSIITDTMDVHGNWFETAIFSILGRLGWIRTVHIETLLQRLSQNQYLVSAECPCPIPIGLRIKRTRLIDRGLRFLYG